LTRRFGDLVAVREVSIEVAPGEIFGLIGSKANEALRWLILARACVGAAGGKDHLISSIRILNTARNRWSGPTFRRLWLLVSALVGAVIGSSAI
jgi:hypothetical protein